MAEELSYEALRNAIFQWKDAAVPEGALRAVIMETVFKGSVVTLAAMSDGQVNVFFSRGGGIVGAGSHEGPAGAARTFAIAVAQNLEHFRKTTDLKPPKPGETKFYALIEKDVLGVSAKEPEFRQKDHKLAPVFQAAHALVTEVQKLQSLLASNPEPGNAG